MKAMRWVKHVADQVRTAAGILTIVLMATPAAYSYWAGGILLKDTHCVIAGQAVNDLDPAAFPDIRKFAEPLQCSELGGHPGGIILRAASNEESHFELPGGRGKQFWFHNEILWAERVCDEYQRFNFQTAYDYIGRVAHLNADGTVPAHAKVVFHGGAPPLQPGYYYDPDAATPLPIDHMGLPLSDDFEYYTASDRTEARECPDSNPACWDRRYRHRVAGLCLDDPCDWKFWLGAAEEGRGVQQGWAEGQGPARTYGGWGRGCEQGRRRCVDTFHDGSPCFGRTEVCSPLGDWFGRSSPKYPEVARGQLFRARQVVRQWLDHVSRTLPPLQRNFRLSAEQFTRDDGAVVTFDIMENRSRQVLVSILAVELDRDGIPVPGSERSIITDEGIWSGLPRILTATPAGDLSRLPWEGRLQVAWHGDVDGDPLVEGAPYALWVKIYDGDDNESPDIPDASMGGLWSSIRRFRLIGPIAE